MKENQNVTLNNGTNVIIIWPNTEKDNIEIQSEPICLNEHHVSIKRRCSNGEWSVKPNCSYVADFCPINFNWNNDYCVEHFDLIAPYDDGCKIPGNQFISKTIVTAWIPHLKIRKNGLQALYIDGAIISQISNECPGTSFFVDGIKYFDCNAHLHHVCAYKPNHFLYQCPINCKPAGLNTTKCYCKETNFCNSLAKPTFESQYLTLQQLQGNDKCNYYGNEVSNLRKTKRNCYLCEMEASDNSVVNLKLKFKSKKYRLYLIITSAESLYPINDDLAICFKDGENFEKVTIKKINVDEKKTKNKNHNYITQTIVYELNINDEPAEYFCIAQQKPNLNLIQSNYVVARKKSKQYIYVTQLTALYNITAYLNNELVHMVDVKLQLYRMNPIKDTNYTNYLYHITHKSSSNVYGEYYKIEKIVKKFANTNRNVTLNYFRDVDECFPDVTIALNTIIKWNKTKIGNTAYSSDVCLQENGLPLIRKCIGNFLYGMFSNIYTLK